MKQKSCQSTRVDGEIENRNPNDMHGERAKYNRGKIQTGAPDFVSMASIHPNICARAKSNLSKCPPRQDAGRFALVDLKSQ